MGTDKLDLKFIWKPLRQSTQYWKRRTKVKDWHYLTSTYYETTVIRTVQYSWKSRQIDQQNRIDIPETDPKKGSQLTIDMQKKKKKLI